MTILMRSIRRVLSQRTQVLWPKSGQLQWESSKLLQIGDVKFFVTSDDHELRSIESSDDRLLLGKTPEMVERAATLARSERVSKILDMGIFKGGSVVLYDQLFRPQKIVAIEYSSEPVEALTKYIAKRGKSHSVKPFYGVNQGDRKAMESILISEFPNRDVDLVVDDASHLYEETRTAFNTCFPYLKSGGRYVIEDWAWAHWSGDFWQKNAFFGNRPALSNLLVELFMLEASRPDLVDEICVTYNLIIVKKGAGFSPQEAFNIGDHYLLRGKTFNAWI